MAGLALLLAAFTCLGQFAIAGGEDFFLSAFEFVLGGEVTDGAVQTDLIVMTHEIGDQSAGVVERQGHLDAEAVAFEGFVPAFDLAVALWIIGGGFYVRHARDANKPPPIIDRKSTRLNSRHANISYA